MAKSKEYNIFPLNLMASIYFILAEITVQSEKNRVNYFRGNLSADKLKILIKQSFLVKTTSWKH